MATYDQFHDPGFGRLQHLLGAYPKAAEFLKEASIEDTPPSLPPGAYAWAERRMFPIHSPEHAAFSGLYAKEASDVPEFVQLRIKEACYAYDVPREIFEKPTVKMASPVAGECIFDNGTYPVRSADEVKTAELRLVSQASKLALDERTKAFGRLVKAAEFHGVKLTGQSYQLAGKTASDARELAVHLDARAYATKSPELKMKFAALASAVRKDRTALRDPFTNTKLAQVIDKLDTDAGFKPLYGKELLDPVKTVFNTVKTVFNTEKTAGQGVEMGGRMYSLADLSRIPVSMYSDALGPDIVPAIAPGGQFDAKMAMEVLNTLPADIKRSFGRTVSAARI